MSDLREDVIVNTGTTKLRGKLFVGADGLPRLRVYNGTISETLRIEFYTPTTFPAAWTVCYQRGNETNLLYDAWTRICDLRQEIVDAQREAEQETPQPEDDLTAAKRYQALEEE